MTRADRRPRVVSTFGPFTAWPTRTSAQITVDALTADEATHEPEGERWTYRVVCDVGARRVGVTDEHGQHLGFL